VKILKYILISLNVVAVLLLLLCYFSPLVDPQKSEIFGMLGLIFPFLIIVNLIFVILWLFVDMKFSLLSLIMIFIGWNSFSGIIGLKLPNKVTIDDNAIKIMSYNIRALSKLTNYPTLNFSENKEKFSYFLRENGVPDILCLQETTLPNMKFFENELGYRFFTRYPGFNSNTAILSKYRIKNMGRIDFDRGNGDCVWADILIRDSLYRFYSVHLHSNTISLDADRLLDTHKLDTERTYRGVRGMFVKYRYASRIRYEQALKVKNHINSSPYPVILCGDFNDTPQSYIYHELSAHLSDSFKERGIGFGTTWAGNLPGLKIDYILTSPSIRTEEHLILRRPFSDHYPIVSTLKLPR